MKILFPSIHVYDLERSLSFYQDLLGFTETHRFSPKPGTLLVFLEDDHGGTLQLASIEDSLYRPTEQRVPSYGIALAVENLSAVLKTLRSAEITPDLGPFTGAGGQQIAFVSDPNGVSIELIES